MVHFVGAGPGAPDLIILVFGNILRHKVEYKCYFPFCLNALGGLSMPYFFRV